VHFYRIRYVNFRGTPSPELPLLGAMAASGTPRTRLTSHQVFHFSKPFFMRDLGKAPRGAKHPSSLCVRPLHPTVPCGPR